MAEQRKLINQLKSCAFFCIFILSRIIFKSKNNHNKFAMKKTFYVLIMLSFFLFSCGGSSEQATDQNDEAVKTEQSDEVTDVDDQTIKDCDDFLDKYDQWTDDYLEVVEAYTKDPTNIEISQDFMALSESMENWYLQWTDYAECASSEKYEERWQKISDKVDNKLEELGIDN